MFGRRRGNWPEAGRYYVGIALGLYKQTGLALTHRRPRTCIFLGPVRDAALASTPLALNPEPAPPFAQGSQFGQSPECLAIRRQRRRVLLRLLHRELESRSRRWDGRSRAR